MYVSVSKHLFKCVYIVHGVTNEDAMHLTPLVDALFTQISFTIMTKKKLMANDNEEEFKKSNFVTNNKQQCHGYVFSTKLFLQCKMIRVIGKLFVNKFTVTYQPFVIHLQGHFFFFLLFIFLLHFLYFLLLAFCPYLLFNDILLSVTPM